MKITPFENNNDDLTVVNAARVSMDKRKSILDKNDEKLIHYLMSHRHFSPFYHANFCFLREMPLERFPFYLQAVQDDQLVYNIMDFDGNKISFIESGSLLAYLKQSPYDKEVRESLASRCPISLEAYEANYKSFKPEALRTIKSETISEYQAGPYKLDHIFHSFEIEIPLFVARQWFKHQIGFARNEVSRRYTTENVKLSDIELRKRPKKGIKQGSSDEVLKVIKADDMPEQLDAYNYLIECGAAPECARAFLPQSMMVKFIETGRLISYLRLLSLRNEKHAQKESQLAAVELNSHLAKIYGNEYNTLLGIYDKGVLSIDIKRKD